MPLPLLPLVIAGAGSAIGGIANAIGSASASSAQQRGAREARGIIDKYYTQAAGYQQPYYQQGTQAYQQLGRDLGAGTYDVDYNRQFNYQEDPGYAYRQREGMGAIEGSAAAGGTGLSGATMRALQKFGQGLASQEYGAAYGRFTDQYQREAMEKAARYGRAASMAGTGVGAATNLSNLATGAGQAIADTTMQGANAQAAGRMGVASSLGSIGQNIGQSAMLYGMYQQPNNPYAPKLGSIGQPSAINYQPNTYPYYG